MDTVKYNSALNSQCAKYTTNAVQNITTMFSSLCNRKPSDFIWYSVMLDRDDDLIIFGSFVDAQDAYVTITHDARLHLKITPTAIDADDDTVKEELIKQHQSFFEGLSAIDNMSNDPDDFFSIEPSDDDFYELMDEVEQSLMDSSDESSDDPKEKPKRVLH